MRNDWFTIQRLTVLAALSIVCVAMHAQTPPKTLYVESATALPASRPDTPGTGWALLVGVGAYRDVEGFTVSQLNAPAKDVATLRKFLTDSEFGAFPPENVTTLVDTEATKQNILFELADLRGRAAPEDLVLFYFSGHGYRPSGDGDDGAPAYILPYITSARALNSPSIGCINYDDIMDIVQNMEAKKVVVFLDACHAGGIKPGGTKAVLGNAYERFWNEWEKARGHALLLSSDQSQLSYEEPDGSVFTKFLIRGLKGDADKDKNAIVGFTELAEYLERAVPLYTRKKFGRRQVPTRRYDLGPVNGDIPLAVNQAKWNTRQHKELLDRRNAKLLVGGGLTPELRDFGLEVTKSAHDKALSGRPLTPRETALLTQLDSHIAGQLAKADFVLRIRAIYRSGGSGTVAMARLRLEVIPADATVTLTPADLLSHAISPQAGSYRVPQGDYRLSVTRSGYGPHEETLSVDSNLSRTITLTALLGAMRISVTPKDATVEVTPVSVPAGAAATKTLRVLRPGDRRELPIGTYRVAVTKRGYRSEERRSVSVRSGQVTDVDFTLKGYATIRYPNMPPGVATAVNGVTRDLPVEVLEGAHAIKLQREGYEPIELSPTLAPLEEVDLSPDWKRTLIAFDVRSNPAGADVTLDGSARGKTPITLRDVPTGDHELQVALAEHEPVTQTLALAANPKPVTLTLERSQGTVRINSNPPGASIRIGRREHDMTPATVRLPVGNVTIHLDKPLYRSVDKDVRIRRGQNTPIRVALIAQEGTLTIESTPPGATVSIAGRREPSATPAVVSLPPGPHDITLTLDDHEPHTETVTLADRGTAEVNAALLHETQLHVTSDPPGIEVALGTLGKHRTPTLLRDVRPGSYEARTAAQGYNSATRVFTVGPNRRNTIELVLSPKSSVSLALRSTLLPGLGQFSGGRRKTGVLFLLATLGAGVVSGLAHVEYDAALSDYHGALARHSSASQLESIRLAKQDTTRAFEDVDSKFTQRQLAVAATGVLWGANVLHALIAGPAQATGRRMVDRDLSRWNIEPHLTLAGTRVVLNHRF
jgi:hypothetical protein